MEKQQTVAIILGALLTVSEVLALIPQIKSNSIFQLAIAGIKKVLEFIKK